MHGLMNKLASTLLLVCSLVGVLGVSNTVAAAVIYDEAVNGDLDAFYHDRLTLSNGVNSVLGSSAYLPERSDFDGFVFSLAPGMELNAIKFIVSQLHVLPGTTELNTGFGGGPYTDVSQFAYYQSIALFDYITSISLFDTALPSIGAGDFSFRTYSLAKNGPGGDWHYELQFIVGDMNSVPEPAAIALLCLGLAGLGVFRRRRQ